MSLTKHTQNFPLVFFVNGRKIIEKEVDPEWTLLYYLRNKLQLCGTKHGCGEGGCGACTVMVSKYDRIQDKLMYPLKVLEYRQAIISNVPILSHKMSRDVSIDAASNKIIIICPDRAVTAERKARFEDKRKKAPICSMHGLAVTTVEGIGSTKTKLHPVQETIAKSHGSQCGFCTPGIVMSMYALLRSSSKKPSLKDLEIAFQGNLCRCTGYRPILEGFKTFTEEWELIQNSNIRNGNCSMGSNCCKLQNDNVEDNMSNCTANHYTPYDVTQEPIFPPELKLHTDLDEQYLIFRGKDVTWYRPTQLNELLELKHQFPDAKIVVGNTEIGVETKFKHFSYPIRIYPLLINELTTVTIEKFGIRVGAAVTLQDMSKALNAVIVSEMEHRTRIFNAIVDMLHWFAGQQIRNVAAVGGNIMTGSPISDLNPIFVAAKVELELGSKSNGRKMVIMDENFFTSYRCNIVRKDEILVAIHIPFTTEYQHFFAYKQARRRDDDTAIVNCAINATFKPKTDIISKIQMAFGGMGPTIVVPKQTCAHLINRPWDEATLEEAYEMLIKDLPLLPSAPGGMTQYRRSLTLSFFFKAYLAILPKLKFYCTNTEIRENYTSAIDGFFPQTPKASQYYQITSHNKKVNSLGKPLPHLSSFKQAAGEACYCDDIPLRQSELHLAFVLSTRPYAKFELDASDALGMNGVQLFISAEDISKDRNSFNGPDTEPYFAPGITRSHGQILGAVVAINRTLAQKAARKVKVTYEDLYPVVITIEDAIAHTSFFDQPIIFEEGNVDDVFATAPHILEGDCRNGAQEHFYLEPHSAIAVPRNEDDDMEITCTAQHPTSISKSVASVLNVSENKIVTKVKRLGGGFGGKEYPVLFLAVSAAIAASRLGVPVRCVLERDEDMLITGARHPFYTKYKCAFNSDGKILGCEAFIYSNAGYAKTMSVGVLKQALLKFDGAYNIRNVRLIGRVCKTNLPSNTAFRGFGAPQVLLAGEFMIREIAEYLNKDVVEVAKLNLYKEGDITFAGQRLEYLTTERCWSECVQSSNFQQRRQGVDLYNSQNRWKKRGISIVPMKYGMSLGYQPYNQGAALVHVYTDGSVLLSHGGVEMGQGLHTKIIQVASQVLQISTDKIYLSETSTDKVPNATKTAASITCDIQGPAVVNACNTINERLEPYKITNPKGRWEDWVLAAYIDRVSLSTTGFYKSPYLGYDFKTKQGVPFMYFSNGVGCSEVEIDCLTGDHQVLRTDIVMDVGESLNPAIDVGQIEGAFMQGYGLYMIEELMYGSDGSLLTKGPGSYKLPGFGNVPLEFNVSLLKGAPNPHAIYSSKGIGEPPLLLASSVLFAAREAIKAARIDSGISPTTFKLYTPVTSAKIRMACEDHLTSKVRKTEVEDNIVPWNVIP